MSPHTFRNLVNQLILHACGIDAMTQGYRATLDAVRAAYDARPSLWTAPDADLRDWLHEGLRLERQRYLLAEQDPHQRTDLRMVAGRIRAYEAVIQGL